MINLRCVSQPQFPEGFVEGAVGDLWEPWMREADQLLDDDQLLNVVYQALVRRAPRSRTFGRLGVPAEIVVRMLLLKHLRNWSFDELEREVRPNLLYREFTRVAAGIVPDAKTLSSQARALGPEAIKQIHQRVVALAVKNNVVQGRKMRVDTTVVETNIHHRMSRVKLVYSAGVSPARARVRGPVAWIVRRKETESRKSIDKAILGMVSESSGRNESKRTGGPENVNPRGRTLGDGVKAAWNVAIWPMRRNTLAG
jgi:transposase, IS5 family